MEAPVEWANGPSQRNGSPVAPQARTPRAPSAAFPSATAFYPRTVSVSNMDAIKGVSDIELDLTNFAPGTYFVNIDNGVAKLTERIVKQ